MMNRNVVKPMNKTRPNRVIFRMSDQELELLNQRVKESGMTRQDCIQIRKVAVLPSFY